jgi:hypothetical protein
MKTFLNLSICVDSDLPLDDLDEVITLDIEYALEEMKCKVINVTPDREQALAYLKSLSPEPTKLGRQPGPDHSQDVYAVLERYNLQLPKPSRTDPPWRVPTKKLIGEIQGLSTLRGEIVATNGIMAFLIIHLPGGTFHWSWVHWDSFVPDDLGALGDLPRPERKERKNNKVEKQEAFLEFVV